MEREKVKIGLIGMGKMGSYHFEKLSNHPGVQLVGVFDKDPAHSNSFMDKMEVKAYPSCEELLFDVDAVVIASPTPTHFDLAKKSLENNLHVFVEKPMCDRVELASELVKLAQEKNLILQTGFVERYRWISLFSQLATKPQQKPLLICSERNSTGPSREKGMDVVSDLMIHDIDLALWMIQEPPKSFTAEGFSAGLTDIDAAYVRLEFPSGAVAHLKANWISSRRHRESQIIWNERIVNFDLLNNAGRVIEIDGEGPVENKQYLLEHLDPLKQQLDCFVSSIQKGTKPSVSGVDGLRALEISEALRQKIKDKQVEKVRLSPLEKKFLSRFWGDYVH